MFCGRRCCRQEQSQPGPSFSYKKTIVKSPDSRHPLKTFVCPSHRNLSQHSTGGNIPLSGPLPLIALPSPFSLFVDRETAMPSTLPLFSFPPPRPGFEGGFETIVTNHPTGSPLLLQVHALLHQLHALIHSKSDKVCELCFSVSKNLRKKSVKFDKEFDVSGAFYLRIYCVLMFSLRS